MTTEEKLEYFKDTTMRAVYEESNRMLAEYTQNLDKIFDEHKELQNQKAEMEIRHEKERIQRDGNAQLAREQMHIKRRLSQKQSELKEKLFGEVTQLLQEYKKSEDYTQLLVHKINRAKAFAKGEQMIIYIDPEDKEKFNYLQDATHSMLTISSFGFGGGIRCVIPKKNILIDESFETKYQEAKENFKFDGGVRNGK